MLNRNFNIQFSWQFIGFFATIFLLTVLCISLSTLGFVYKLITLFALTLYALWLLWHEVLFNKTAIKGIRWAQDWQCFVQVQDQFYLAEVLGESIVTPYLCVLRFKTNYQKGIMSTGLLFRDSIKDYRQFLACLRTQPLIHK